MVRRESELVGGRLCLDFVNTVSWRGTGEPRDNLVTYADLLRWGVRARGVSRTEAATLRRLAVERPRSAVAAFARAREVREAIYRVVVTWKHGRSPGRSDLVLVNGSAPPRAGLVWNRGCFAWSRTGTQSLESVLWPVVWSFADLVSGGERRRVSSCGSAACGWLFYDESRGQRRRWCSMRDCGNRAKARRHYERTARAVQQ